MTNCLIDPNGSLDRLEPIELDLPEIENWKRSESISSSSDSGYKRSEEPASTLDTESLLTFSSCNLSSSEKLGETPNDIATPNKDLSKTSFQIKTSTFPLSNATAFARQPDLNSSILKSKIHGINDLKELTSYLKHKPNVRDTSVKCKEQYKSSRNSQEISKRLKMSDTNKSNFLKPDGKSTENGILESIVHI